MNDEFKSIDEPPEEYPEGTGAADFAPDETIPGVPGMEPEPAGPGPAPVSDFGGPGGGSEMGMPEMEPGLDEMGPGGELGPEPGSPEGEPAAEPKQGRLKSLMSTPKGIAIVVAGIVGVLAVLGIVGFLLFGFLAASRTADVAVTTVQSGTPPPGTGGSAAGTMTAQDVGEEEGLPEAFEVFETKDPFRPLLVKVEETPEGTTAQVTSTAETTTTSTSGGTTGGTSSGTTSGGSTSTTSLTLKSISYEDGQWTAVLVYGGKSYSVHAGEVVDSSPWKVLSITSSSVTVQYGEDQQATLSL